MKWKSEESHNIAFGFIIGILVSNAIYLIASGDTNIYLVLAILPAALIYDKTRPI